MSKNYYYTMSKRGLCSELNGLVSFFERDVANTESKFFVNSKNSQYFKKTHIYEIFDFPQCLKRRAVSSTRKGPCRLTRGTNLSKVECSNFFKYKKKFEKEVEDKISSLNLPEKFCCFHIRRGDKVLEKKYKWGEMKGRPESKRYEFDQYLAKISKKIGSIFIMTDDYKVIDEAKQFILFENLPIKLYYLTEEKQDGHSTDLDIEEKKEYDRNFFIQFFSEIEIAKLSATFVGTRNSNVYRYISNTCTTKTKFKSLE